MHQTEEMKLTKSIFDGILEDKNKFGTGVFPGPIPKPTELVHPPYFSEKKEHDFGLPIVIDGECSAYCCIFVTTEKSAEIDIKEKIYIPDELVPEVQSLVDENVKSEDLKNKYGIKKRAIMNAIVLNYKNVWDDDKPYDFDKYAQFKIFDQDLNVLEKEITNHKWFKTVLNGDGAIEYWKIYEERDGRKFPVPHFKYLKGMGVSEEERQKARKNAYNVDSYVRKRFFDSMNDWENLSEMIRQEMKSLKS